MAYNPYLYMPNYNGNNQYGYQNQPIMPYQQTASQPVNGLISVTGIEGARAYQLVGGLLGLNLTARDSSIEQGREQ